MKKEVSKRDEKSIYVIKRDGKRGYLTIYREMKIEEIYCKVHEIFGFTNCKKYPSRIIFRSTILGKNEKKLKNEIFDSLQQDMTLIFIANENPCCDHSFHYSYKQQPFIKNKKFKRINRLKKDF